MITIRRKHLLFGFLLIALMPVAPLLAAPGINPATEALVVAGDIDGVAAALANLASSEGDSGLSSAMEQIAALNPDIAGAVVNAAVRNLSAAGNSAAALAPTVRSLVAGAMNGVSGVISPDQAPTYAENIAINVRQVVGAVSGGDQGTQNALLASARAGVSQSTASSGSASQVLHSDVSVRLQGDLNQEETSRAVESDPVVVSHGVEAEQQQSPDGDQGQGQQSGQDQEQGDQGQDDQNQDGQGQNGQDQGNQNQDGQGQNDQDQGNQNQDGQGQNDQDQGNQGQGNQDQGNQGQGNQNQGQTWLGQQQQNQTVDQTPVVPVVDELVQENPQVDVRPDPVSPH